MSENNTESILVDGMFFKKPHENAPDFVKGSVSMKADELVAFLQKHKKADGWVNVDLLKSKDGSKLYFKLNTFQPEKKTDTAPVNAGEDNRQAPDITDGDIPF